MSLYDHMTPRELKLAKEQAAIHQIYMKIKANKEKAKNNEQRKTIRKNKRRVC